MSRSVLCGSVVFFILLSSLFGPIARAATITVDTIDDDQTANGNCTLREAILAANTNTTIDNCTAGDAENDAIDLTAVIGIINLGSGLPTITENLNITGPGMGILSVNANGTSRVITVDSPTDNQTISISGLTLTSGDNSWVGGGAFVNYGDTLELSSCGVTNNTGINYGGGIYNRGTVKLTDVTVSGNNVTNYDGGGIYNQGGTLTITNSTISGNTTAGHGAGIFSYGDTVTITQTTINGNIASLAAGGIYNWEGTLTLTDSTVSGNTAKEGGGIDNARSECTAIIENVTVNNNTATNNDGGGIYNRGTMTLNESLVNANTTVAFNGAGIYNQGTLTLANTTVSGNTSGSWAGGIFNNGTMTLNESLVNANSDVLGVGGITQQGTATFINSTISGNAGIGVQNTAATGVNSTFINSTIASNTDTGYAHSRTAIIYSTIVANNGTNCTGTGSGTYADAGWNLDSDDTCSFMDVTDLPNTDPLLGPLQDNGGPTQTHALQTGSPAIDAGDNIGCPATDQRGITRPHDGDGDGKAVCDIGAYELFLSKPTPWILLLLLDD